MKKTLISLAVIGALTATTPAFAENVSIEYQDLNLSSAAGQKVLANRIDRAARKVCGLDDQKSGSRIRSSKTRKCYEQAKRQATQQMAAIVDDERLGG